MKAEGKKITLQINSVVTHVDGYWLRHYASDFLSAAQSFELPKKRFSPVRYYLVCHSIELSLKSFLFSAGFKKKDRKGLKHDLENALGVAEANGLSSHIDITPADRVNLIKANRLYLKKEFEYFESLETIYDPHDFNLGALESFAARLIDAIEAPVRNNMLE